MFLKSLTLKGFKSFADTTTLDLEPGITVVVGPNGSGKSNIVDAVAWVLGAQGPRTVRSSKMDDVIFAGTANKSALGRAEVQLTIDNQSGILPIELSEITLSRTLFRSGDSEYAINGVPCRLLDVQELLSDSGVGRTQHVIVSQGQLDAILNARPEDRRAVVEEAAGVLKFRRRRERAERRLEATEGNLLRLQDLLREVRRQLRPLERQAEAARRHGGLVEELTGMRVFLTGRDLTSLRGRLARSVEEGAGVAAEEGSRRQELTGLDTEVVKAEAQLSASGGDDLGDDLVRVERLREQARGLTAVLEERRRGIDRDRSALAEQLALVTHEAEVARLTEELAEVGTALEALGPEHRRLADSEGELRVRRESFAAMWPDEEVSATGRAAEVRGQLVGLRSAVERGRAEYERLEARQAALGERVTRLDTELARLGSAVASVSAAEGPLEEALTAARAGMAEADAQMAASEGRLRAADGDRHAWAARAEALAAALAETDTDRLTEADDVAGRLVDLVDVDPGWEAAFEAAAGSALGAAVVTGGVAAARAVLARLRGAGEGAVLPLAEAPLATTGGVPGTPVRAHVRSRRPEVDRALDALLRGAVVVEGGWEQALDVALAHPDAVVVTMGGDRFSRSGWRVGVGGRLVTAAALDDARRRAESAAAALAEAEVGLDGARGAQVAARGQERQAAERLDDTRRRVSADADALRRIEGERADHGGELEALRDQLVHLGERLVEEETRLAELDRILPALETEEAQALEAGRTRKVDRSGLEEQTATVATLRTDLEVRGAALEERRTLLSRRLDELDAWRRVDAGEHDQIESRRAAIDRRALVTDRLSAMVLDRAGVLEGELATLHERRQRQSEASRASAAALDGLRRRRQAAERHLEELRERSRRTEIEQAEVRLRIETAVEACRRDLDCEPDAAMAAACPPLPEGTSAAARARELERELRMLGPVNPLALEEFDALQERHQFLQDQLDDVKSTRRDLARVIRAVDEEIVGVFAAAFADVSENFTRLFETLFPGGHGRLTLTDPGDLLSTGIEVEARPGGKNIRKLSLLSGGERSLTALAFLFAVFRSRPSPFYLMDEVEAALDDVNLHRFLELLEEFRKEAQLLVVSHQKRTMEAADCLYGVTMQPGGSSKVVSERVAAGA